MSFPERKAPANERGPDDIDQDVDPSYPGHAALGGRSAAYGTAAKAVVVGSSVAATP